MLNATGVALYALYLTMVVILGRTQRTELNFPATAAATAANIGLNLALVPPLGIVGAALALVASYVVVLALPDMMTGVGLTIEELQRAAPIVSGFLLGYVAMLPLIGRISDLRGRIPVLVGSLVVFSIGSLVTAAASVTSACTLIAGAFRPAADASSSFPGRPTSTTPRAPRAASSRTVANPIPRSAPVTMQTPPRISSRLGGTAER